MTTIKRVNYDAMTVQDLKFFCEQNGIKTVKKDTKESLIQKLTELHNGTRLADFEKTVHMWNNFRPALIAAHKSNNRKAICSTDCEKLNIEKEVLENWKTLVSKLRETVWAYVVIRRSPQASRMEVETARSAIFKKWNELLKVGEASLFHKSLHIIEADVEDLIGFSWVFVRTETGTACGGETPELFRKKVESLIGTRIAADRLLSSKETEAVNLYYGTAKTIKSKKNRVESLNKEISTLQSDMNKQREVLKQLHVEDDVIKQMFKWHTDTLKDRRDQLKKVQNELQEAENLFPAQEAKAKEILNTLHGIEE